MGTCVPTAECQRKGGSTLGSCASGYGVCCACKYAKIRILTEKLGFFKWDTLYHCTSLNSVFSKVQSDAKSLVLKVYSF